MKLSEALPRGWVKPNHLYVRRMLTKDGRYKYVYYHPQTLLDFPTKNPEALRAYIHQRLSAEIHADVNLNKKGRSSFGTNPQGIVVTGAPNILGRKFVRNKEYIAPEQRDAKHKLKPGSSYKGVIAGYKTDAGAVQKNVYVYPIESIQDRLAKEAAQFHNLDERLQRVHDWADKKIHSRSFEEREIALSIKLLADTKERIGGSGGRSVPKKILSKLNQLKVQKNWSMDKYVTERESLKEDTFGILDMRKRHMQFNGDVAFIQYTGKASQMHKFTLRLEGDYLNQLKIQYYRAKTDDSPIFSISPKDVGGVYSDVGNGLTPHKERHALAQRMLKDKILAAWKIDGSIPAKQQLKKLRESFYNKISVPLGHKNKSHTITTALNNYVGLELRNAYTGLVDEIRQRVARKVMREALANLTPTDWMHCMTSVLLKADLAKSGALNYDAANSEVMMV